MRKSLGKAACKIRRMICGGLNRDSGRKLDKKTIYNFVTRKFLRDVYSFRRVFPVRDSIYPAPLVVYFWNALRALNVQEENVQGAYV